MKILFIHGANLNLLGKREPIYGDFSYEDLRSRLTEYCTENGVAPQFFISNHEGEIVERVQKGDFDALVINAGAYSHYSLAIADALRCVDGVKIEVHITNIHARDRHTSVVGAACDGVISGLKMDGYLLAVKYIVQKI